MELLKRSHAGPVDIGGPAAPCRVDLGSTATGALFPSNGNTGVP